MKNRPFSYFILKLLAFLLLVYVADFFIGNLLNNFYFKQNSGFQYRTTYAIDKTRADVLVFGSSRANHHYYPEIIESKLSMTNYNAGRDGNFIFYNYAVLEAILKRYTPKIVVLDVVKGEFRENAESYDRISTLLPYYDSHPEMRQVIELKSQFERVKLFSKIYPYNSSIFSIAIGNTEHNKKKWNDYNGFVPLNRKIAYTAKGDTTINDFKIDSVKIEYFESFIKQCKNKGIQLFIVVSPYFLISKVTDKSIIIARKIAIDNNVNFLDYSQDTTFRLNHDLFADYSHLNLDGAKLFSRKFMEDITKTKSIAKRLSYN